MSRKVAKRFLFPIRVDFEDSYAYPLPLQVGHVTFPEPLQFSHFFQLLELPQPPLPSQEGQVTKPVKLQTLHFAISSSFLLLLIYIDDLNAP